LVRIELNSFLLFLIVSFHNINSTIWKQTIY
jgi:hypothetical protein